MSATASMLPTLPNIRRAKLPAIYEEARTKLETCARVDECATWASKAEALASYAKQAEDNDLRKMADRIQARAIRRCGELLKQIKPHPGGRPAEKTKGGAPPSLTRKAAALEAGLSDDQRKTALRVANVPAQAFERAVESDDPPTVTELAKQGTQRKPLVDLEGRDPEEFACSTEAQGHLRRLTEFALRWKPCAVVRGAFPNERETLSEMIVALTAWLHLLRRDLREAKRHGEPERY